MDYLDDALEQLRDALPSWWAKDRTDSELYRLLVAIATDVDGLAEEIEGIYADQALSTARDEALRSEWAPLYGVSREDLPLDTETLRGYLQARAAEDGSLPSLEETLLALVRRAINDTGTALIFDVGGAGLTFPADGSGLTMFQPTTERGYLRFPADGSGLTFPADGSGLLLPTTSRLEITENFADSRLDVTVRDFLVFDRPAFARAVNRFREAHMVSTTITETTS